MNKIHDEKRWFWIMDYCKKHGLPPAQSYGWETAKKAWEKTKPEKEKSMPEYERIEYLRKNDRIRTNKDTGKRVMISKGEKRGVLICMVDPEDNDSVIFGFSLCNPIDRFDYIKGIKEEGFGLELAKARAEKWRDHLEYFIQRSFTENEIWTTTEEVCEDFECDLLQNPNPRVIVEIPPSIVLRLKTFIERCRRYYKDKNFPAWVEQIEQNNPIY